MEHKIVWLIIKYDSEGIIPDIIGIYEHSCFNKAYEVFMDAVDNAKDEAYNADPNYEECVTLSLPDIDNGHIREGSWTYDDQCGTYISVRIRPLELNCAQM